jgi:phage baseplate assembly protein W
MSNLRTPFARDQRRDFAAATGKDLLRSQVTQVVMTDQGELPWRTNFGSRLSRFRQRRNDAALSELARVDVRNALTRWLSDAALDELEVLANENELEVSLAVSGVDVNVATGG